jgi:hypothetical protein
MPAVKTPTAMTASLDPSDRADYQFDFSGLLDASETVVSHTTALYSAAVAAGLLINDIAAPAIHPDGKGIVVWFTVASGSQNAAAFDNDGTDYLIECLVGTSASRKFQRTFKLNVKHQ